MIIAREGVLLTNGVFIPYEGNVYVRITTNWDYTNLGRVYECDDHIIKITPINDDKEGWNREDWDEEEWYFDDLKDIQLVKI